MSAEINEKEEWQRIRQLIKNYANIDDNWKAAFLLFEKRIKDRYFTPINIIIALGNKIGEGFSIVSLQCSLLDAFASFRNGKINSELAYNYFGANINRLRNYIYRDVGGHFTGFLISANIFKDIFYTVSENNNILPSSDFAISFYQDVRCALLHDCMTRNNWVINTIPEEQSNSVQFIERKNGKKYIYRTLFQDALDKYLESYIKELNEDSTKGCKLRKKFARRYDFTHEIRPDNAIWWQ